MRRYLHQNYGIEIPDRVPDYKQYMKMVKEVKDKMKDNFIHENSFVELSSNANNVGDGATIYEEEVA